MIVLFLLVGVIATLIGLVVLRWPVVGLYMGVALSGVLMAPDLPFVGVRLAAPDVPLLLALVGLLMRSALSRRVPSVGAGPVRWALSVFLFFLFVALLSFLFNAVFRDVDALNSFIEVSSYFYGFLLACATIILLNDWNRWRTFVAFWLVGVAAVSFISVLAIIGLAPEWAYHGGGRIKSTAHSVNQLHSYLAPAIPMLVGLFIIKSNKRLLNLLPFGVIVSVVLALSVTGSRTAFVLFAFVLLASIWYSLRYFTKYPLASTYGVLLLGGLSCVSGYYLFLVATMGVEVLPEGMRAIARPFERSVMVAGLTDYLGARGEQLTIILENLRYTMFLGVGPGNFMEVFDHRHSVHSTYLGVLIEVGWFGLLLLLFALGLVIRQGYRFSPKINNDDQSLLMIMALISVITVCIYGVATFGLRQRIFWLLIGMLLAAVNISASERRSQFVIRGH